MTDVRRAVEADVPGVRAVVLEAFARYVPRLGTEPAPMRADHAALVRTGQVWIAVDEAGVAGVIVLVPGVHELLVETVAVRPSLRGQGLGFRLMMLAEEQAAQSGRRAVTLYTNALMTENLDYYPRLGYVETGRSQQHGFHRVFFRKDLPAGSPRTAEPAPRPPDR